MPWTQAIHGSRNPVALPSLTALHINPQTTWEPGRLAHSSCACTVIYDWMGKGKWWKNLKGRSSDSELIKIMGS